ncbi:hypothetical protein [Yoonia sp. F2084L]|nr:hypothetical protein [Yoonia sp. F2084L]
MKKLSKPVSGVRAPTPRPTVLGAAVTATVMTFPVAVTILFVDLLLL